VRWYITYRLSYRDLVAMMAERDIKVSHTTIMRWVLRYVPEFEERWARYAQRVKPSWRVDETAVSVRGGNHYLYRAVDRDGQAVDHLLYTDRSRDAAQAFFRKAVSTNAATWPRTVNLDGNMASHLALRMLGDQDPRWRGVLVRDRRYLNNIVEQDHRAIKRRCASMLGFKTFKSAPVTLAGVELAHRIRKKQFSIGFGGETDGASLRQLWAHALAPVDGEHRKPIAQLALYVPIANAPKLTERRRHPHRIPKQLNEIKPLRSARKFSDGGGLYLLVRPGGARCWRYNYRFNGKQKTLALGMYPAVSLEEARVRHRAAQHLLVAGTDPR
jgi:transposase-like protein